MSGRATGLGMGRVAAAGVAALCGALAASPYLLSLSGSSGSLILVYLAQLPLFLAGLWGGVNAAALAGLAASLILLAASNVMAVGLFAALNVVPVVLLVRQALLARPAADGATEWYPLGLLTAWLTGLGLTGIAAALLLLGGPEGVQASVREALAPALDRLFEENASDRDEVAGLLAMIMPGVVAVSWMVMTVTNGTLAQGLLARFGANWRPSPDLAALTLPLWVPAILVLAAAAIAFGGTARFLGINAMIALAVPFCLAGLAVLHAMARRLPRPTVLLVGFYVLAGLFGWPLLIAIFLGLLDASLGVRRRLPRASVDWREEMLVELILLERVEKLGQMGQLVKVKPGFARNYLLPQKKALRATKENLAYFESQRAQLEANNLHRRSEATEIGSKIEGLSVVVIRQAGESGQLYGSVSARDIAEAVTQAGFTIEKRQVVLERPIKNLGIHPLKLVLHPEVAVTITANVAQSAQGAEMQAKGIDPLRRRDEDEDETALGEEASSESPSSRPHRNPPPRAGEGREGARPGEAEARTAGV